MKKILALVLVLCSMVSMVACSGKKTENGGEPAVKDTFVVGLGAQPNYLDPCIAADNTGATCIQTIYDLLFSLDAKGNPVPCAVESYEISDDGLTYTLKLKDNKWSDGQPVLASEYEFGAKRAVGMGAALAYYSYFITDFVKGAAEHEGDDVANMADVAIHGDDAANTLTFELVRPCPYFLGLLTNGCFVAQRAEFSVEHESTWADDVNVPVTGPYVPTKIQSNEELIFVKNEHFRNADKVVTPNVVFKVMEDQDAQLLAFQNGEIDMALNVEAGVVASLYAGKPELIVSASVVNYYIQMNGADFSSAQALSDVRVRRAIQLGMNREDIVAALDAGNAYYPLYGYVPKGVPGTTGDFRTEGDTAGAKPYVYYDVEEAKALMEEAGYGPDNRLKLVYKYNSSNLHDTIALVMQAQLAEIYIDVTFESMEVRAFFTERDTNGNYELARGAMSADYLDATTYLDMLYSKNQTKAVVSDPVYDALLDEAKLLTGAERSEKLHEAEKYLVETMAYTNPIMGYTTSYLLNPAVSGVEYDPTGNTFFAYVKVN